MRYRALVIGACLSLSLAGCSFLDETPSDGGVGSSGDLSVNLAATPISGPAPLQVRLESNASGASTLDYRWELANRTFTGGANRSHTFTREGTFDVSVTVSDGQETVGDVVTIQVGAASGGEPGNQSPTVGVDASPTSGVEDLTVAFTAAASDPDGDGLNYAWDFGDGNTSSNGDSVSHEYDNEGTYTATVTVSDGRGGYGSDEIDIAVADKGGGGNDDSNTPPSSPNPAGVPDIIDFDVNEDSIAAGTTVVLSWSLAGGQPNSLELSNSVDTNVLNVLGQTRVEVIPTQTTTYTLTAKNAAGQDVETETVRTGDDDGGDEHGGDDDDDSGGDHGGGDDHGGDDGGGHGSDD